MREVRELAAVQELRLQAHTASRQQSNIRRVQVRFVEAYFIVVVKGGRFAPLRVQRSTLQTKKPTQISKMLKKTKEIRCCGCFGSLLPSQRQRSGVKQEFGQGKVQNAVLIVVAGRVVCRDDDFGERIIDAQEGAQLLRPFFCGGEPVGGLNF